MQTAGLGVSPSAVAARLDAIEGERPAYIMGSQQAVEYGVIDRVSSRRELPAHEVAPGWFPLNGNGHR